MQSGVPLQAASQERVLLDVWMLPIRHVDRASGIVCLRNHPTRAQCYDADAVNPTSK